MSTTRTKSVVIIFGLLIALAVLSGASLAVSQLGFLTGRQRPQLMANGTPGPNGTFQRGTGNGNGGGFQGGGGNGGGGFQGGGNFQGRGGGGGAFAAFGAMRSLGINPQVFLYMNIGMTVLGILLVLWCAYGIWKGKKAALNWALVLAVLFLLGAVPGVFGLFAGGGRFFAFSFIRPVIDILMVVAAVTMIGLSVLPSVRDNFA